MNARRTGREIVTSAGGVAKASNAPALAQRAVWAPVATLGDQRHHFARRSLMDALISALQSALAEMLEAGFELPFHVAVVSRNGAFRTLTFTAGDSGLDAHFWHSHVPEGHPGFALPVNMMVVDSRGEASRVVIDTSGRTTIMQ
jgi:hypothetical protein